MNKNKWIIGAMLSIFLCATVVALGQQHRSNPPATQPKEQPMSSGRRITPETPASIARSYQEDRLDKAAIAALKVKDYAAEEDYARQSMAIEIGSGLNQELLAQALYDQGKDQEAFQVYKVIVADEKDDQLRNLIPYARLLLKSGQWAQAVAVYNKALPQMGSAEIIIARDHFSPDLPQPNELTTALHVAQGLTYVDDGGWNGPRYEDAMKEFAQALQLAPNSPLTNYYYGFGWQQLDPKSRTKIADASRAKIALQKAAASEDRDIKKAAGEALQRLQ